MVSLVVLISSLLIFSFSARGLGRAVLSRQHHFPYMTPYNSAALRFERSYKILTFTFLTVFALVTLVMSFHQVLTGMPF